MNSKSIQLGNYSPFLPLQRKLRTAPGHFDRSHLLSLLIIDFPFHYFWRSQWNGKTLFEFGFIFIAIFSCFCCSRSSRKLLYFPLPIHPPTDCNNFLKILMAYTMKTIYFLISYHLGRSTWPPRPPGSPGPPGLAWPPDHFNHPDQSDIHYIDQLSTAHHNPVQTSCSPVQPRRAQCIPVQSSCSPVKLSTAQYRPVQPSRSQYQG